MHLLKNISISLYEMHALNEFEAYGATFMRAAVPNKSKYIVVADAYCIFTCFRQGKNLHSPELIML